MERLTFAIAAGVAISMSPEAARRWQSDHASVSEHDRQQATWINMIAADPRFAGTVRVQ